MICVQWCTLNNTWAFTFSNLHNNSIFSFKTKINLFQGRVEIKIFIKVQFAIRNYLCCRAGNECP